MMSSFLCSLTYPVLLYFVTIQLKLVIAHSTLQCTQGFMEFESLATKASQGFSTNKSLQCTVNLLGSEIILIPDMKFTCNAEFKSVYVTGRIKAFRDRYPELQIWRNSDKSKGNVFGLVSSQEIRLTPNNFSPQGYYHYVFNNSIAFEKDDAIGIYQPSSSSSLQMAYYISSTGNVPTTYMLDIPENLPKTTSFNIQNSMVKSFENQVLMLRPVINTQMECLENFPSLDDIKTKASFVTELTSRDSELRLFPNIRFMCSGFVTKWTVGAKRITGEGHNKRPQLLVWRPLGKGRYVQVHSTTLFSNGISTRTNIYDYYPNPPVKVQFGDFLGLFQPEKNNSELLVFYQQYNGPKNLVISRISEPVPTSIADLTTASENDFPLITMVFNTSLRTTSRSLSTIAIQTPLISSILPSSSPTDIVTTTSGGTNLLIIIFLSLVGGVIFILIAVVVTIIVIVVIKAKRQNIPDEATPTGPARDTANGCTYTDINREDVFGASYSYDVCVETKRNFSYGIILPHQLNNISLKSNVAYSTSPRKQNLSTSTRETDSSLDDSYQLPRFCQVPQPYQLPQQSPPDLSSSENISHQYY